MKKKDEAIAQGSGGTSSAPPDWKKWKLWGFLYRSFFSGIIWIVASFGVSELMPAFGLKIIGPDGRGSEIKFIEFADWKLWIIFMASACMVGVIFSLVARKDTWAQYEQLVRFLKSDVLSMLLSFGAVLMIVFVRGGYDARMLVLSLANYILAFIIYCSNGFVDKADHGYE